MGEKFKILQVSTVDSAGGAERVASNLLQAYRTMGYPTSLVVGYKRGNDSDVLEMSREKSQEIGSRIRRKIDSLLGLEDFEYPEAWQILDRQNPDIIQCHNLHGNYFDLRALPWLSRQAPVVLLLHDAWLLSGHCAHSFDCERWKTGCGSCPDLTIYPPLSHDGTGFNWRRKRRIFQHTRFYVATPSQWLMDKVNESMMKPYVQETRIIPNGVDLSVFKIANRSEVRLKLGLPRDAFILLFSGYSVRNNPWKDYKTLRAAIEIVGRENKSRNVIFIILGEEAPLENVGSVQIQSFSKQLRQDTMAEYYQAADIYVHSSKVDTFPNSILESLACGTAVIASSVGGIPEQVKGLSWNLERDRELSNVFDADAATGYLVPPANPEHLAKAILYLLESPELLIQLGQNAARDAEQRFGLDRQATSFLDWYSTILGKIRKSIWSFVIMKDADANS